LAGDHHFLLMPASVLNLSATPDMAANFYPDRITSSLYSTFEVEIYDRD
jgi:hypothetical protein